MSDPMDLRTVELPMRLMSRLDPVLPGRVDDLRDKLSNHRYPAHVRPGSVDRI